MTETDIIKIKIYDFEQIIIEGVNYKNAIKYQGLQVEILMRLIKYFKEKEGLND